MQISAISVASKYQVLFLFMEMGFQVACTGLDSLYSLYSQEWCLLAFLIFMCMSVLVACMYVYHMYTVPVEDGRVVRSPAMGDTDVCCHVGAGN